MSTQKYFFKGRDFIKLRSLILSWLIAIVFTLAGVFSFFVSPGYSLGWKDEEWLQADCPKNVSGKWISDNPEVSNLKSIFLNKNEITYTSKKNETQKFGIIESSFVPESQFVEIKLKSFSDEKETVIKIRPHLVHMEPKGKKEVCLIKVFNFKTEKHAKKDRYSGWNIFRLQEY